MAAPPAPIDFGPGGWPDRRPLLMGVVNATPDSFYPGSRAPTLDDALGRCDTLLGEGADLLDIGGESSRPGACPLSPAEEMARVVPLIEQLVRRTGVPLSVDTRHPATARAAVAAGATVLNDIGGLRDPAMVQVAVETGVTVVVMHMRGDPATMQKLPPAADIMGEVRACFEAALRLPLDPSRMVLDPGLGFGKTPRDNLLLINRLGEFAELGCPLLVGASRKSFIGYLDGTPPEERLPGSLAAALMATRRGAAVIRCHDVGATRQALEIARAIERERYP